MRAALFALVLASACGGNGALDPCVSGHECEVAGGACTGNTLTVCQAQADGCRRETTVECPNGCDLATSQCTGCSGAPCVAGDQACANGELTTCGFTPDGCLGWGPGVECQQGTCADATTCTACVDECSDVGAACSANTATTCAVGPEGCLVIASTVSCAHGCDGDACATCVGTSFTDAPATWTLPTGYPANELRYLAEITGMNFATVDLTGDGLPDLVITGDVPADTSVGTSKWLVHVNTGTGFAATATTWTLPTGYPANELRYLGEITGMNFSTTDLTGDGRPDLVITGDVAAATSVGTTKWLVHANTGAGFAATATTWTLPTGYPANELRYLSEITGMNYTTADLTGDGKPDLVITGDVTADTAVGTSKWLVHANTGSGFAATPTTWTLPAGYPANELRYFAEITGMNFSTTDLDGDQKPDLVITGDVTTDTSVGTSKWLVHKNTGSGFAATATAWTLPAGYPANELRYLAEITGMNFSTVDLTSDGLPDLVITGDVTADTQVGTSKWLVHANTGTGFATAPTTWTLPSGYPANELRYLGEVTGMNFSTTDINGDHIPDLVITGDVAGDTQVGTSRWRVHFLHCE